MLASTVLCDWLINHARFSRPVRSKTNSFLRYRKEEAALESAAAAATDVTTAMLAVKIELEEKKRTNDLLQRALVSERRP